MIEGCYDFEIEADGELDSESPWSAVCEIEIGDSYALAIGNGHTPWEALADCIEDAKAIEARVTLKFRFTFTVQHSIDLSADQIWPDGDAPRYPSVEDAQAVVAQCGGPAEVLEEWKLDRAGVGLAEEEDSTSKSEIKPEVVRLRIAKLSRLRAVP